MPTGKNPKLLMETPRGAIYSTKNGGTRLVWNEGFGPKWTKRFQTGQSMFDVECMRLCSKFVPFDTGMLDKSVQLHTAVGSGELCWETPYARKLYYRPDFHFKGAPTRGGMWGQRMKAINLQHLASFFKRAINYGE